MKIGACVVLYNPQNDCIENINSYLNIVDNLIVLDNSINRNNKLTEELKKNIKVEYINFQRNTGIANALKVGVDKNIERGCDFCLTMDQDSKFPVITREELELRFQNVDNLDGYGILSLNFNSESKSAELSEVKTWITSGNFINLKNYVKTEGFNTELFIDFVDFDLNEKFNKINKKIAVWQDLSLIHCIGNPKKYNVLGVKFTVLNHSPIRYYYRFRNALVLYKKNKKFYKSLYFKGLFIDIPKILFFEKDKRNKLKLIRRGRKDAKNGKLGEFTE